MNHYDRNPITRTHLIDRLLQKEGETLEELAEHLGISEASVRKALIVLRDKGNVKAYAGKWVGNTGANPQFGECAAGAEVCYKPLR